MAQRILWGRVTLAVLSILIIALAVKTWSVVQVFLAAVLLAYLLDAPVKFLEKQNCPRLMAISLIYALLLILLIFLGVWAIPVLNTQAAELGEALPEYIGRIKAIAEQINSYYQHLQLPEEIQEVFSDWFGNAKTAAGDFLQRFLNGIIPVLSSSFVWFLVPIISFYLLKDKEILQKFFWQLLPLRHKNEEKAFLGELHQVAMNFLQGSLLVGSIVGLLTAIGLWLTGIDFALIFGLIAGICNIIPYFGPIIGAVPAVVFAFFQAPGKALLAVVVMVIVQQVESHFITPKIMGDKLGLHPVVVMFALLAGGKLIGFWGLILAVPLAGMLKIIFKFIIGKAIYTKA